MRLELFRAGKHNCPGLRVQDEEIIRRVLPKVEHLIDRVRNSIEGALTNPLTAKPVILDETDDRTLIGHCMIDEI